MAYTTGQEVTLSGAALYVSSDATTKSNTVTGTYYIWSGSEVNGRIRVTISADYCGKSPASTYVTGWVDVSAVNASDTTTTTTTASSTTASVVVVETKPVTQVEPDTDYPGMVGYLGAVPFIVTTEELKTLTDFKWSHSANYTAHARHLSRPVVEFTGVGEDEISFNCILSTYLGSEPMADYITWLGYLREGTAVPMKLGEKYYGYYRWIITSLSYSGVYTDKAGNWTHADVSVKLVGYEKNLERGS